MISRDEILQQALALPPDERAFLADALQESLPSCACHPQPSQGSDLTNELRRRSSGYRNGHARSCDAAEVLVDLRRRQIEEPPS